MPRFKITIEYDGTNYSGWQRQASSPSITAEIEKAIFSFSQENIILFGAGRTDAGVHAFAQVAHFDLVTDRFTSVNIINALNYYLKNKSIIILDCEEAASDFHARFSAQRRFYQYHILNRSSPPGLDKDRVWHVRGNLNLDLMQEAAQMLVGIHDFTSFRAAACQANSPIKTIDFIKIEQIGDKVIVKIAAKSFLHHMVRNIMGALKDVSCEKLSLEEFKNNFTACNRKLMPATAPATGLYFWKVEY